MYNVSENIEIPDGACCLCGDCSQSVGQLQGQMHSPDASSAQLATEGMIQQQNLELDPNEVSLPGADGCHGSHVADAGLREGLIPSAAAATLQGEPGCTRGKIREFLTNHTAYELIPESGKVVLLDIDLPLRQAFHALHEQGISSAPLFDSQHGTICGMVSASDFITTLQRLRNLVSTSSNPMSEAEMDQHTIRGLRDQMNLEGNTPRPLISCFPNDSLYDVVQKLYDNHCSVAPIVDEVECKRNKTETGLIRDVLHSATLSGILACLIRHFRTSLASLPLFAQPLHALPIGTWCPNSQVVSVEKVQGMGIGNGSEDRRDHRRIAPIVTVHTSTPLIDAFGMLLEGGFSCLPVVDDDGLLVDVYARADITTLAKSNAYSRLQFEDVTIGQALTLAAQPDPQSFIGSQKWGGTSPAASQSSLQENHVLQSKQRIHACTTDDTLKIILERLSVPGVRRLFVVNSETKQLEGIVSLSDIAFFLMI